MEAVEPTPTPVAESPCTVPPTGLTIRQREFLRLYLLKGKPYFCFVKAFNCKTEDELAKARSYAYRLLNTAEMKAAIKVATESVRRSLRIEADALLREVCIIGKATMGDYFEFDSKGMPKMKPAEEISAEAQRAIQSIEQTETKTVHHHKDGTRTETVTVTTRVRLHDKIRALQMLMRHLGLDKPASPLESLLNALPLDLQHKVAEVLRSTFRRKGVVDEPPAVAPTAGQQLLNGYHPAAGAESN